MYSSLIFFLSSVGKELDENIVPVTVGSLILFSGGRAFTYSISINFKHPAAAYLDSIEGTP